MVLSFGASFLDGFWCGCLMVFDGFWLLMVLFVLLVLLVFMVGWFWGYFMKDGKRDF